MKIIFSLTLFLSLCLSANYDQDQATGLDFDPKITKQSPRKIELASASYRGMASSYSLEKWAPFAGNQGDYGTCNAFACAYASATMVFAQTHNLTDKTNITKCVFSPTFLYQNIVANGGDNCKTGSHPLTALQFMYKTGLPFNRTVPYVCGGKSWSSDADLFTGQLLGRDRAPDKKIRIRRCARRPVIACSSVRDAGAGRPKRLRKNDLLALPRRPRATDIGTDPNWGPSSVFG